MPTNIERAEALLHIVLRISAIRTDRDVTVDVMASDLRIGRISAHRAFGVWVVRMDASPDDGSDSVPLSVAGEGPTYRAAMDDALADYADKLMTAARVRMDWAEEEGEVQL